MSKLKRTIPAVFYFQPTEIHLLESPDEIKRWEQKMREDVGIKIEHFEGAGSCTESRSGTPLAPDDCDQD
ncbi:hypothetical protein [Bacillus sp. WP8]|uniref:hypothetical protein n=1 Tax=Bacillus sp. WP8 TaxID=756828 RepID=UPI0011AAE8CF|nr:hypothetical protein [Bacillus sp. WP8]